MRSEGLPVPNYATEPLWEELSAKLSETDLHRFGSLLTHVLSLYDVMRQYPEAEDQFIRLAKFMSMRQYEVFQLTVAPIRGIGVRYKNTQPPSQKILEALNPDKKMSDAEYNRIMSRFVLRMRLAFHDLAGPNFRVLQQSLESAGRVAALFAHFPSPLIASMAKFMGAPATFLGSIQYLFGIMTRIGQPFANDAEVMAARVALASEPLTVERRGRLAGLLAGWSDDDEPDNAE